MIHNYYVRIYEQCKLQYNSIAIMNGVIRTSISGLCWDITECLPLAEHVSHSIPCVMSYVHIPSFYVNTNQYILLHSTSHTQLATYVPSY